MKKIIFILCLALILSCKSKKAVTVEKTTVFIKLEDLNLTIKNRAYNLGKRLLESCNTSRFKAFSTSDATDKVIHNATPEKIAIICKKINQRNGRFLGLNLIDVTYNKSTAEYFFHYNIDYEKKLFKRELRVTINSDNKVSAITTKEVTIKPL